MTAMQAGNIYRYFRVDADHDISADTLEFSLDAGETWSSIGVDYIAPEARPPRLVAVDTARPPADGFTGYWWRVLTGPDTSRPLPVGTQYPIRGRLTDSPETPHFAWKIDVSSTD